MKADFQLNNDLIVLRPPQFEDIPAILSAVYESMAELHQWMDWATDRYNETSARNWMEHAQLAWDHSNAFQFVILDAANDQLLGVCGLDGVDEKRHFCNLGYWVRTGRTRQGIGSQAIRLAAKFGFQNAGLARAEIVIAVGNLASQRAAQKAGAHHEGVIKNHLVVRLDVYDAVIYSLSPADFEEVNRLPR
jgi:ribosomal-protein-serine acetyltransferase